MILRLLLSMLFILMTINTSLLKRYNTNGLWTMYIAKRSPLMTSPFLEWASI